MATRSLLPLITSIGKESIELNKPLGSCYTQTFWSNASSSTGCSCDALFAYSELLRATNFGEQSILLPR